MYIIFQVSGGLGKSVASTPVIEALHKKYPKEKIIVVTAYPDVFVHNPYVFKSLDFNHLQYFYRDYIQDKDSTIFVQEPYNSDDYINGKCHLSEAWAKMCGVKIKEEKPYLHLNQREIKFYQNQLLDIKKPIMIIHSNGGAQNQPWKYSWTRDIPAYVMNKVVAAFKDEYAIMHIRREDQLGYEGTISLERAGFREICAIMMASKKRLLIDSFPQHAAAALDLPSTVLWIGHSPKIFGYDLHDNIISNKFTAEPDLKNSFLSKFSLSGEIAEFPYNNEEEIFDADEIIEKLKK